MVYILNTNLNNKKNIQTALCGLFGIGKKNSNQILRMLGISNELKISNLSNSQIEKITQIITNYYTTGPELKKNVLNNIQRLVKIASYRGFRHIELLPLRGQRTHTNAQTAKKKLFFAFPFRREEKKQFNVYSKSLSTKNSLRQNKKK